MFPLLQLEKFSNSDRYDCLGLEKSMTCQEIKMSEGGQAVSGKYWFHSIVPERTVLAPCDMKTEGEFKRLLIHIFYRQKSVNHEQKR